jgi:hypothetical protein
MQHNCASQTRSKEGFVSCQFFKESFFKTFNTNLSKVIKSRPGMMKSYYIFLKSNHYAILKKEKILESRMI